MYWTRTANAGGLLEIGGRRVLLDGVCTALGGYEGTPPDLLRQLLEQRIDLIAFTHCHADHFLPAFVGEYLRRWPDTMVMGPAEIGRELAPSPVIQTSADLGGVRIHSVPTRHIGGSFRQLSHQSMVIQGAGACLWFTGDASPTQFRTLSLPRPDTLLVPFAFAATETGWRAVEAARAERLILLHMPRAEADPSGIWPAVEAVLARHGTPPVLIPAMGETVPL